MNIIMILLLTLSYPSTEPTLYEEISETVDCENCDEID